MIRWEIEQRNEWEEEIDRANREEIELLGALNRRWNGLQSWHTSSWTWGDSVRKIRDLGSVVAVSDFFC